MKPIDWRQLRKLLRDHGCEIGPPQQNYIRIVRGAKTLNLAYGGDDRELSKRTLSKIQRDLGLKDDLAFDSDVFFGRAERIDRFIVKFRGVLERLADA